MVQELCGALPPATKIGMLLEGGYDLAALEASLEASLEALVGGTPSAPQAAAAPEERHLAELDRAEQTTRGTFRLG